MIAKFIPEQEFDENGYKLPTSTFTIFTLCEKCGGMNLKPTDEDEKMVCIYCGPGKEEFDHYIMWVLQKRNPLPKVDSKPCKVCGKIHEK